MDDYELSICTEINFLFVFLLSIIVLLLQNNIRVTEKELEALTKFQI